MCEGRGDLDLEASDVADSEPAYPAQSHQKPEMQTGENLEIYMTVI